ncbi:MAG: NADAR family protein [Rickettsiales bacterium]|jgi:ribA/ribD-fused uncharacterized protein|nr:NADAR family protein [Rickettsiales bacterium]
MIDNFITPQTRFLSNFYPHKNNGELYPHKVVVSYNGLDFDCVENAYQAAKAANEVDMRQFVFNTPFWAKKFVDDGGLKIRSDWHDVRMAVMINLVQQKFRRNLELAKMLLATGEQELVEGNTWGDTYWGVCEGRGENNLGRILMMTRRLLRGTIR